MSIAVQASPHTAGAAAEISGRHDLRKLAQSGRALLFASATGNGINYVFGIFLARSLGSTVFGIYALGLTIFNIVALIIPFGLDSGIVKFLSAHLALGERARARRVILQAVIVTLACSVCAALGLGLFSNLLTESVSHHSDLALVLMLFSLAVPCSALGTVLLATLQGFQVIRPIIVIRYLWEPLGKFALAAIALWSGLALMGVVGAIVITLAVSAAVATYAVWKTAEISLQGEIQWDAEGFKALAGFCFPLVIANTFTVIAPRSDILILGYWAGPQDVGVYLAAFQTSAILALVLGAFDVAFAPIIGRAWAQREYGRLEQAYQSVAQLAFMITAPLALLLVLFAGNILDLFGPGFGDGARVLTILVIGQLFNSVAGAANTILLMSGKSRLVMINTVVSGVGLVVMTSFLIPVWGAVGAATAASLSLTILNTVRVVQVWRLYHIQPCTWRLMRPAVSSLIMAGVMMIGTSGLALMYYPVVAALGGLIYLGIFAFIGFDETEKAMINVTFKRPTPDYH